MAEHDEYRQLLRDERNRLLADRIRQLEELNGALKEQLQLQETDMKKCQTENQELRRQMNEAQRTHHDEQQGLRRTNDELRNALRDKDTRIAKLASELESKKEEIQRQYREKQHSEHQLFELREDFDKISKEHAAMTDYREELTKKHKELLIMGERCHALQEQVDIFNSNYFNFPNAKEMDLQIKTLKHERNLMKNEIGELRKKYETEKKTVKNMEEALTIKDKSMEVLRAQTEKTKEIYHKRLETEKRRVNGSERCVSRLEQQILELYRQLEMKKEENRLRDLQLSNSHEDMDSDSDISSSPKNGHTLSGGPQNADSGAHCELSSEQLTI